MLSSTRSAPLHAARRLAAPRSRPARRPLIPVRAASSFSLANAATAAAKAKQQQACLSHLTDLALPRARARLAPPFAEADATLAVLVADPLLVEATRGSSNSSSSRSRGENKSAAAAANAASLAATRAAAEAVDAAVDEALSLAYGPRHRHSSTCSEQDEAAHLFLQRCLYRVNRLSYIFHGEPLDATYGNERAPWLLGLREIIESAWQPWELEQMAASAGEGDSDGDGATAEALLLKYRELNAGAVEERLLARLERDRYRPSSSSSSPSSPDHLAALHGRLNALGFAHLLAAAAHDGLTEASRQSRVCAGDGHPAASACFRVLSDEYGGGQLERKHSTFYARAMSASGVLLTQAVPSSSSSSSRPPPPLSRAEQWIDLAPWQSLAATNHSFLLAERRRHLLRYFGALAAFELSGPRAYEAYAAAADRIAAATGAGADDGGDAGALGGYWALHVKEDTRHGPQAMMEVALPLARLYGDASAWEVLLGYDQEGFLAARATAAVRRDIEAAGGLD